MNTFEDRVSRNSSQRGKTWFLTGASSGFGLLLAEYLLQLGANVVATARRIETLEALEKQAPEQVQRLTLDVTKPEQIEAALQQALARWGSIDVLVNNAGFGVLGGIEETTEEEFLPMFETNVLGLIRMTRAFLPQFRKQRQGNIVLLSSQAGLVGAPGWGYYNTSKFAVEGFGEALAGELQPLGVGVTIVEPGPFRTKFLDSSARIASHEIADYSETVGKTREYLSRMNGRQPGDPQKAVEAIVAAVSASPSPRHLILGKIALDRFRGKIRDFQQEVSEWEAVTLAADFPAEA